MAPDEKSELQQFLYRHGISFQALADEAGVTRQTIYNAISGDVRDLTRETISAALQRICTWRKIEYVDPFVPIRETQAEGGE